MTTTHHPTEEEYLAALDFLSEAPMEPGTRKDIRACERIVRAWDDTQRLGAALARHTKKAIELGDLS